MKQNKNNKPVNQLDSDTHQQTTQNGYQKKENQTNSHIQDAETDEEEIIEIRNRTDYESLPQSDSRTGTQNIKIRNS